MRRLIRNFVAKIFGIRQCQCPPEEEVTITYATEEVGHCDIHNNYKYSCPDCNKAIRNK